VAAGATLGAAVLAGPAVALATLIMAGTAGWLARAARARRGRERAEVQLLAALRLLAAELEAGTPAAAALAVAAEQAPGHAAELGAAAAAFGTGSVPAAGGSLTGEQPAHAGLLSGLAPAWQLAATTGAPLAEVCGRVAHDLAAHIDQRRAVTSALAGARSSAALLAVLPVLGLLLGTGMQARPVPILLQTSAGHGVLVAGVALDAAGVLWTHWLAARAERP
jgi:tight adherence protein B